jgi:hypothetical protein
MRAIVPFIILLASATPGCAISVSGSVAPTVDTTPNPGFEARAEAAAAAGSPTFRVYGAAALGGGYSHEERAGYMLVSPEAGVEFGQTVRGSFGSLYSPRFLFTGEDATRHGVGVAGQALFPIVDLGGEDSKLMIGPRLQTEYLFGAGDEAGRGLFSLGIVVRWVAFDTTNNRW